MRYILLLLFTLMLFSCGNENAERADTPYSNNDAKPQGFVGDGTTSKAINGTITIVDQNKDTNIITTKEETRTFTYTIQVPDIVVKPYKKDSGVVVVPPTDPPTNPGTRSNLIFEASFDGSNPFDANKLYKQSCCSYSITQSKSVVRSGDGSFRAEVKGSDPSSSSGYRAELITSVSQSGLKDNWYGYSSYFENWNACSSCGEHCIQWHPAEGSGSANLGIYTEKGTFHVRLNADGDLTAETLKDGKKIISGKYYDFVWYVKWGLNGVIKLWIDGELYVDYKGETLTKGNTPYFKLGINRWNISGVNRVVYYDNLRIGSDKATYKDVAP